MDIAFRPQRPASIEVRDLQVTLGGNPVLRGVDLRIEAGRMVALIGPNGSGKTTLLRCLLGLQQPLRGSVRLLGEGPPGPRLLRRVGYVPQRLQLDPSFMLTVREFLAIRRPGTAGWFWRPSRFVDDQLHEAVAEMDVTRLLDRPVAGLSGGQLQRVLICSSLLNEPELLLLDEPTAGVDTPGEEDFYGLIADVHRRRGLTVVLVSHDLSMVYRHASRVYALNGVICCEGSPDEVMNAESLKRAYGIHFTPYHHHHHHAHGGHGS
jgi:ABC-type Mn2+/Zn2+ transport system ATPase subunit